MNKLFASAALAALSVVALAGCANTDSKYAQGQASTADEDENPPITGSRLPTRKAPPTPAPAAKPAPASGTKG